MKLSIKNLLIGAAVAVLMQGGFPAFSAAADVLPAPSVEEIQALLENRVAATAAPTVTPVATVKEEAKQEAVKLSGLFSEMEKASDPKSYIAVLQKIANLPDYRSYTSGNFVAPKEIPFEQLSGEQAATSMWWYDDSGQVELLQPSESVKFYNEVLFPRYQAFFRKMATREITSTVPVKIVKNADYLGMTMTQFNIADVVNPILQKENISYCAIVVRTLETSFRDVKPGDTLMAEVSIFELARAYKGNMAAEHREIVHNDLADDTLCAVLKVCDKNGNTIYRRGEPVHMGPPAYSNQSTYIFAGFGLGDDRSSGNVFLKISRHFKGYSIPKDKPQDGVTFSAACLTRGEFVSKPQYVPSKGADDDPISLVVVIIISAIAFTSWGSLPYMLWVLNQEKKRRWEPVAIPEGSPEYSRDPSTFSPACADILEWQSKLETREFEGVPVPVITDRKEIEAAYALLATLREKKEELNSDSLHFMNALGEELNTAQTRHLSGSKAGLIIACVLFAFLAFCMIMSGSYFASQFWVAFAAIYYLAMKCPAYKLANPEPTYYRVCKDIVKALGIGSLFVAGDMAEGKYATVYRDSKGRFFIDKDERDAGCVISLVIIVIIFAFAPFIFLLNAICDFFRNYVGTK